MTVAAGFFADFDNETGFGSIGAPFTLVNRFPTGANNIRVANGRVEIGAGPSGSLTQYTFSMPQLGPGTIQFDLYVPSGTSDFNTHVEVEDFGLTYPSPGRHARCNLYTYSDGANWNWSGWQGGGSMTPTRATWYRFKFTMVGTFEGFKMWPRDDPEPAGWLTQYTVSGSESAPAPLLPRLILGVQNTSGSTYFDNFLFWPEIVAVSPPVPDGSGEPATPIEPDPVTVQILYDGDDITALCSIEETLFTSRAGGVTPGDCTIVFRDTRQAYRFTAGKTLELYIDGVREWDGYLIRKGYNYWFETHTANCEPCPHITPRKLLLFGADRNILFTRRVLYNKAAPATMVENIWPADTSDQQALLESMDAYLDDVDGLDLTSQISEVASPDPYEKFRLPGPSRYFGDLFTETAQATAAVFYINPDRQLVYTDVNTPDAPYGISDRPVDGEVGCRDLEVTFDASNMVNDALIWGAGQGSGEIVFQRVQDTDSIVTHGRWQNTGGFRANLWKPESALRIANSIVYGSPSSRRGHKDDQVSVRCTIFTPGFRVADKVPVRLVAHPFADVIPVREMTIRFVNPSQASYELLLSHELDEPWTTNEFWWPRIIEREPPLIPKRDCTVPTYEDSGLLLSSPISPADLATLANRVGHHYSQLGGLEDSEIFIRAGGNYVRWFGYGWDSEGNEIEVDNSYESRDPVAGSHAQYVLYESYFEDEYRYGFSGPGNLSAPGAPLYSAATVWRRFTSPRNHKYPGSPIYVHLTGTLQMTGTESLREMTSSLGIGIGFVGNVPVGPQQINLLIKRAGTSYEPANPAQGSFFPGQLSGGQSVPFSVRYVVPELHPFLLAPVIEEPTFILPVGHGAQLEILGLDVFYTAGKPTGNALFGDGPAENGLCYPVPQYGAVNAPVRQLTETLYETASPYVVGSTKIYVDGLHQRLGYDYEEEDPYTGRIRFFDPPSGVVSGTWEATGVYVPALPDTSTALFIRPTVGRITGYFGQQDNDPGTGTWGGVYWHGEYYASFHNGVDFGVATGTPVYAAAGGEVVHETQAAGGVMIRIYHPFNGFQTIYAHLSGRVVPNGASVTQGQLIGYSGDSGNVTGPHLHWGLVMAGSPEDPLPYTQL